MTLVVTHSFLSTVPDGPDPTLVKPSNWNNSHVLTGTASAAQLNANVVQSVTNDTNIQGTIAAQNLTFSWAGMLAPSRGGGVPSAPQGRLTLTSGTAVPTTDVASATTVYYTPAIGRYVPLWNGAVLIMTDTGGELSQATTDTTKSPAAVTTNSNYDVFVWNDSGTIRATRGPPWTSDTARGTGAGTTELDFTTAPGIPLNKNAITNGPGAGSGTYVGTFRSDGSSQANLTFGTAAAGGGPALLTVWNAYNQVLMRAYVRDSTSSWTYATFAFRALNASNGNRVSFVSGLQQHAIQVYNAVHVNFAAAAAARYTMGFALDSTTTGDFLGQFSNAAATANVRMVPSIMGSYLPQLGFHYIQEIEVGDGTNTNTLDQLNGAGGLTVLMLM